MSLGTIDNITDEIHVLDDDHYLYQKLYNEIIEIVNEFVGKNNI